jgi:hypothetical protein
MGFCCFKGSENDGSTEFTGVSVQPEQVIRPGQQAVVATNGDVAPTPTKSWPPPTAEDLADPNFKGICSQCGGKVLVTDERGKDPATDLYFHMKCHPTLKAEVDAKRAAEEKKAAEVGGVQSET